MRFDEMELEAVPLGIEEPLGSDVAPGQATLLRRALAVLTDISLFAALVLALFPLTPPDRTWIHLAALAGFVVLVSYYYFVGAWLLWGKTVGGAIFDVRVVGPTEGKIHLRDASLRWVGVYISLLLGGIGFMLAVLPGRRSLPDRMSDTRCV
jgi:uncharacterized RDD family membrane protein YckC